MTKRKTGSGNQGGAKDKPSEEFKAFEELAKKVFKASKKPKKKETGS